MHVTASIGEKRDLLRTRAVWLMALPFLWFSSPTTALIGCGMLVAVAGVAIRAWAAGTVEKGQKLATRGPYALVRHPLYLGGLFIGVGVTIAGGHWIWPLTFLLFFTRTYPATIKAEESFLERRFGTEYSDYRARVPAICPSLRWHGARAVSEGFSVERYRRKPGVERPVGIGCSLHLARREDRV